MQWYYYLHTNGDLIGKNPVVVDSDPSYFDSDFVKRTWKIETEDRESCWIMLLEAVALGACIDRVRELADKWKCDKADSIEMILRIKPNDILRKGIVIFVSKILDMDVEEYWKEVGASGDKKE